MAISLTVSCLFLSLTLIAQLTRGGFGCAGLKVTRRPVGAVAAEVPGVAPTTFSVRHFKLLTNSS